MAKTPPPPRPAPTAQQVRNKDPIRLALATFIAKDLWKLILAVLALAFISFNSNFSVRSVVLEFGLTDDIGILINLGPPDEW